MKVGDYVRTYDGVIGKIIDDNFAQEEKRYELDYNNKLYYFRQIVKSSQNIIDLIGIGDYVNGLKVSSVGGTYYGRKDKAICCDYCENKETGKWTMIYDDEIKSIVTKEMMESVTYYVK